MQTISNPASEHKIRSDVITKAFINATNLLGLSSVEIINLLGISIDSWSRISKHEQYIEIDSKEAEIAILFIRVYRYLDTLLGGNAVAVADWLRSHNEHLEGLPIAVIQTIVGLEKVDAYLSAMHPNA